MIRISSAGWTSGPALVCLLLVGTLGAQTTDETTSVPATVSTRFDTAQATAWIGTTQAVVFRIDDAAKSRTTLSATVEPLTAAEVVGEVTVLPGASHGVVRLRGLSEGDGVLRVGDAKIDLAIRELPAGAEPAFARPRLVTPTMGARVWGEVTAAIEVFDDPVMYPGEPRAVTLEVEPAGVVAVRRVADTGREHGPNRTVVYALDTSGAEPGTTLRLRALAEQGDRVTRSGWTAVGVVRPTPGQLIDIEAEAQVDVERPERYRGQMRTRKDAAASGGAFVIANSNSGVVPIVVDTGDGGWYQAMATVGANIGGGAWPTLGLRVGDDDDPICGGIAAVGDGWRRVTIGRPVWLDAGEQTVLYAFENDFFARRGKEHKSDRNARFDRLELLRLDGARPGFDGLTPPSDASTQVTSADFRVSPTEVWHGRHVTGRWWVEARANATAKDGLDAPLMTLEIEGEPVLTQRAWWPKFELPATWLQDGPTRFRIVGRLGDGRVAASPEQVVFGAPLDGIANRDAPLVQRIAVDDVDAWDDLGEAEIKHEGRWGRTARLMSNGTIGVKLPDGLSGRHTVALVANGQEYEGKPIGEIELLDAAGEVLHAFEPAEFRKGWREVHVGATQFDGQAERLTISFTNDAFGGDEKRDRNLFVAAVVLRPASPEGTVNATPTVAIRYPIQGDRQYGVDAVVADVRDDEGVKWVELLIDGQPTPTRLAPRRSGGRVVLPVVWRGVEPGTHELAVRVSDNRGNTSISEPVTVELLASEPTQPTRYDRAVRLLERFAFGFEPHTLGQVLVDGETSWIESSLSTGWDDPAIAAAWQLARVRHNDNQSRQQAVANALQTANPLRTRFTFFVDNHFNTWLRKTENDRKAAEHERFVELGVAPFLALLEASATSPAMLRYLDQSRSFGGRINENYAREIMELHTLGVDSTYAQQDVTELSHVLAGWRGTDEGDTTRLPRRAAHHFRFVPVLNDGEPRDVFGLALPAAEPAERYDRARRVVEMLAAHPDTARYVATKLIEHYLVSPAPEPMVDELAAVYLEQGGDLAQVMLALIDHPYASNDDLGPRLKRPLEFAVGLMRPIDANNTWRVISFLDRSGVGMFDRETPDGYDAEPQSYANSNAMLQRWRLARENEWHLGNRLAAPLRGIESFEPWQSLDESERQARWSQAVIDQLAVLTTGRTLGPRSNQAALDALAAAPDNHNQRANAIATFIAQLPESQQQP